MIAGHTLRALALAAAALSAVAIAAGCGGGGSSSDSTAASNLSTCNISGKQQNLGASYVTSIEVGGVDCALAEQVVQAYHQCRQKNGGAGGTCDSPVNGFTCSEGSRQQVPGVQYNATVDCHKGDTEIKSTYTQNL
jgi:hypothetical protein